MDLASKALSEALLVPRAITSHCLVRLLSSSESTDT